MCTYSSSDVQKTAEERHNQAFLPAKLFASALVTNADDLEKDKITFSVCFKGCQASLYLCPDAILFRPLHPVASFGRM